MISVQYISSSFSPSGYGEAAREDISCLYNCGINITTTSLQQTAEISDYGLEGTINKHLENRIIPYKIKIIHLTPDLYSSYMEKGKYHIGRLAWETDNLPKEWIDPLNSIEEIWTMTEKQKEMIIRSNVKTPVFIFPEPLDKRRAFENINPFVLKESPSFIFYSIFQFIERKNPLALIRAYKEAFFGNNEVALVLKTYGQNYSSAEFIRIEEIIRSVKKERLPKIFLITKLLTSFQIKKLHSLGNVYVSSSTGEGWGRPIHEAMIYGKPVISTDCGGIIDYLNSSVYFPVKGKEAQAVSSPQIPWYTSNMKWIEADESELAAQMKFVYENYHASLQKAKKVREYVMDQFGYEKVGKDMKERLLEIEKLIL